MEKKKRQQPVKEMLGLLAAALGWGALALLACYGLFLYLHVDYEDLMIWAPLYDVRFRLFGELFHIHHMQILFFFSGRLS